MGNGDDHELFSSLSSCRLSHGIGRRAEEDVVACLRNLVLGASFRVVKRRIETRQGF
jgi:hypothetical protein